MPVTTNTRKLAALLGASGAGIHTDGTLQTAAIKDGAISAVKVAADVATQSELDAIPVFDDNKIQTNLALLAFKAATNGSLAKYNLQDQIVDEYTDTTGVNAGDSTNETLQSGSYSGNVGVVPTITHNAPTSGTDGLYSWYRWNLVTAGGSFQTDATISVEYLIVAGGGGGGTVYGGGGGAGGVRTATGYSVSANTYTIVVGDGGAVNAVGNTSSALGFSATGGGYGGKYISAGSTTAAAAGGSGGGAGSASGTHPGGAGNAGSYTPAEGFAGGSYSAGSNGYQAAGGGGAGGAGESETGQGGVGGYGGVGIASDIVTEGTNVYYGGGGGGGTYGTATLSTGGNGGGGQGSYYSGSPGGYAVGTVGTDGFGGGGGGGVDPGSVAVAKGGGSGVVIIRHLTSTVSSYRELILQSTDTTAEAVPTKADMVMLIEDAGTGVGTLNTHIKGWISRYETGGTKTWTEGILVDEGDWGVNKRIVAFHDLDISAQASGTQMAYKITTHSVDAEFSTKVHATSIGWK